MLVTLLVLAPFGLVLAVLLLASRRSRVNAAAAGPPVPPARPSPAGGTAVPRAEVQPSGVMTGPYAYDNGLKTGEGGES